MSKKQWHRLEVMKRVLKGELSVVEAARAIALSRRHAQRLKRQVELRGQAAVIHGNKGRPPPNRTSDQVRQKVVGLFRTKYAGFNDQHFTEKLAEQEGIEVSRPSVQRWLRGSGLPAARKRRPAKHHRRRERKAQAGLMVLWDGSRHAWLEGRGPMLSLMAAMDDATGEILPGAQFYEQECSAGYLTMLQAMGRTKGLPCSIYMDRHGALHRNDTYWTIEEELRGQQDPTQVGRALQALGIEQIYALSPQAKGRVERLWDTLQDRLVSELRLAGARTQQEANVVLKRVLPAFNRRFARPAAQSSPAWCPVTKKTDLERLCSFYYEATVRNDNTISIGGRILDIPPGPGRRSYAKARVEVRQLLDGTWRVYWHDQLIAKAPATQVGELRIQGHHKRSAATAKALRRSSAPRSAALVHDVESPTPEEAKANEPLDQPLLASCLWARQGGRCAAQEVRHNR